MNSNETGTGACIFQTLSFQQKDDLNLSREQILKLNHMELDSYVKRLEEQKIRYRIVSKDEQENGTILLRIRKQYKANADVQEYFDL